MTKLSSPLCETKLYKMGERAIATLPPDPYRAWLSKIRVAWLLATLVSVLPRPGRPSH